VLQFGFRAMSMTPREEKLLLFAGHKENGVFLSYFSALWCIPPGILHTMLTLLYFTNPTTPSPARRLG
jgi:hypothetical protein